MPLNLEDKKVLVAEVTEVAKTALSVVAAEYRGLTVTQMTDLRAKARASGVYMRVVKNTLARKAFAGTAFEPVGPKLKGPLVLAFSKDDPGAAARVVKAFSKDNDKLVATLVSIGGAGSVREGSRQGRESANAHAGAVATSRCAQGADPEVRRHARRAEPEAGVDPRGRPRCEAGTGRRITCQLVS